MSPAARRKMPRRPARLTAAADYSHLSVRTLRRRIADGTLTAWRSGPKVILVDLDQVDRELIRPVPAAGDAA
jgi:pyruvate/2-oxoglutarate dehydrogenase complex dihydrolipoamide acyltransferase (E2) component